MSRNIKVFLVTEALAAGFGGFILPIYVLYFRFYQITLFEVALLAAVFEASVLVAEIPTGIFADRFGRKRSVMIGFALFSLSGVIFIGFRNLSGFIVAEICFGLAEAFISGAAEALAVDSIDEKKRERILPRLFTWRSRIRIAVTTVCMLAAGYLFARNISITFYPVLAGGAAGLVASLFFVPTGTGRGDFVFMKSLKPVSQMVAHLRRIPILKMVFIMSLIANFSFEGADQYWQVLFSELFDINIKAFGLFTAAGAVLAFVLVGPSLRRFSGDISSPLVILLLSGIIISSLPNVPAVMLPYLIVIYFMTRELVRPFWSVIINRNIGSGGRATFISGFNLTCSMGEVASGLAMGWLASRLGLPAVFVIGGAVLVMAVIGSLFVRRSEGRG